MINELNCLCSNEQRTNKMINNNLNKPSITPQDAVKWLNLPHINSLTSISAVRLQITI